MKRIFTFLLFAGMTSGLIAQSLLAHYTFSGNAGDSSGNSYHGTVNGAVLSTDRFGMPARAYAFSGGNIEITYPAFKLNRFTYSLWAKVDANPAAGEGYALMSLGDTIVDQVVPLSNIPGFYEGFGFGSWSTSHSPASLNAGHLPDTGRWYHIAATRDNDTIRLYIDGVFVKSLVVTGTSPAYGEVYFRAFLGKRNGTAIPQSFMGSLDEVRIYNDALSASAINAVYVQEKTMTGIPDNEAMNVLKVYPNPASGKMTLELPGTKNESVTVELYTMSGQLLESKLLGIQDHHAEMEMAAYESGIYFLRVLTHEGTSTRKVTKH